MEEDEEEEGIRFHGTNSNSSISNSSNSSSSYCIIEKKLPAEMLSYLISFLKVKNVYNCMLVSKTWNGLIDNIFWKNICKRDFASYFDPMNDTNYFYPSKLMQDSFENEDNELYWLLDISKKNEEKGIVDDPAKNIHLHIPTVLDDAKAKQSSFLLKPYSNEFAQSEFDLDWKLKYKEQSFRLNITGTFSAVYSAHGLEQVQVTQSGYILRGVKITGDVNVPAGKTTFVVRLNEEYSAGQGKMQLARTHYRNPCFSTSFAREISKEKFTLRWRHSDLNFTRFNSLEEVPLPHPHPHPQHQQQQATNN